MYSSSSSGSSSSSTSEVPVEIIVGSVLGSLVGLSVMIVIIRCICAALKNSSRQIVKIIQPAITNTPAFVVNTATLQGQAITHVQQGEAGYVYPCAGSPAPIDEYEYVSPPLIDQYEYVSPPPIDQYEYVSPHPTDQYEHMSPPPTDQYEYISPTPHRHHDKESQKIVNQEVKY
ncbi:hypothetical protein ACJMK2_000416 [Sinanodonta woodiana]|uniref:Uncharacterized protein n=1 Tax=Sinanodonta woodiana TaxID=1069815 RepID=A0ABD3XRI9_SINWO